MTFLVLALAASPLFGQTMAPPSPETERIVMRHMELVEKGDLLTMLNDMSDPVALIGVAGARVFTRAEMIKRFTVQFSKPQPMKLLYKAFWKDIGYVVYASDPGLPNEHLFAETFFIQNGKIVAYSNSQFKELVNRPTVGPAAPAK
jgi:hypothetical protein